MNTYYGVRSEGLKKQTTKYWLEIFAKLDIPAAPYHTLESLIDDEHLADVGLLKQREHPTEGTILDLRPANTLSGGCREEWLPAPLLGQQTEEILREAGLSDADISTMIAEGSAKIPAQK